MILCHLQRFVKLCQFLGVTPFSLAFDPESRTFRGLTFSTRQFPFWWLLAVIAWQTLGIAMSLLFVRDYLANNWEDFQQMPIAVSIFTATSLVIWYCVLTTLWCSTLRFHRWKRVFSHLNSVEKILFGHAELESYQSIDSRVTLGAVIVLLLVSYSIPHQTFFVISKC